MSPSRANPNASNRPGRVCGAASEGQKPAASAPGVDWLDLFDSSWLAHGNLDDLFRHILSYALEALAAQGASLFLREEHTRDHLLAGIAGQASPDIPEDAKITPGKGIAGRAIELKKPLVVEDPNDHPELRRMGLDARRAIGSSMIVPLLTLQRDCIGVLNVARSGRRKPFGEPELQLASSLAAYLGLAVDNGRLLNRLRLETMRSAALHEQLGTVIENLPVGVVVFGAAGEILHANAESATVLDDPTRRGASLDSFLEAANPKLGASVRGLVREAQAGERAHALVHDTEADRVWTLLASPMAGGGAALVIHEATEHERLTREVHRVRRLAEIGQMTAAIAHEIRNPLTAMRGAAQILQTSPEHALEFGQIIESEVIKLNELCTDFLDFARPLELHFSEVDLRELVRELCDRHQSEFDEAGVDLELKGRASMAWVDRNRIEQVIRNLMLNALSATPRGGRVSLEVEEQAITVRDTGCGMEQQTLEKLFTPFFTTKANGTGLGLSTARKIVDAHGGRIQVQSEPGKGTEFRLEFERWAA